MMATMRAYATVKPTSGDSTIGMTTLSNTPVHFTVPADANAAPISPPMSAWDEDDGMTKYHVMMFQVIAPINAEKTTTRPE